MTQSLASHYRRAQNSRTYQGLALSFTYQRSLQAKITGACMQWNL